MTNEHILRLIQKGRQRGLAGAVEQYGAYVATVVRNVLGEVGFLL